MNRFEWLGQYLLFKAIGFTVTRPLEALAITAAAANPTGRRIMGMVAQHIIRQTVAEIRFYGPLVYREAVKPAGKAAARTAQRAAIGFASSPVTIIGAAAVGTGVVGGAVTAKTVTSINRSHNVSSSSPQAMWSPFGGMQLGTVV